MASASGLAPHAPSALQGLPAGPVVTSGLSVRALALYMGSVCAVSMGGEVWCWGQDLEKFQVTVPAPRRVSGVVGASQIALGGYGTACAVVANDVACWGSNGSLEVGAGPLREKDARRRFLPPTWLGLPSARGVSVGTGHTCAWLAEGTVKCWGNNDRGQLGLGWPDRMNAPMEVGTPTTVPGVTHVIAVVAGYRATCALHGDRTVSCWGEGFDCEKPRKNVELGSDNLALSGSDDLFAVLKLDGTVWTRPQMGQASGHDEACMDDWLEQWGSRRFFQKPGLAKVERLSASWDPHRLLREGSGNGCVQLRSGTAECWHEGPSRPVPDLRDVQQLAVGPVAACAITGAHRLLCWGNNAYGQLGDESDADPARQSAPVEPQWPVSAP